ncbi:MULTISPECIES: sulfite exporter TauE/SafE family protein [unclassified Bradyrhizobium]|uniref:sulfite exporter TauE/SafE family protein n=1 Tax=unclassified Bradyrhizobium TaxID=2631580 RepID=UPI002917005D|nr:MULTISPECIES: sulfite exporter TauE/SafE family protein [unclassified Bradyrhizobium]
MTSVPDLIGGLGTGLVGGFTSGLLGVTPGGGLVVFAVMLLGAEQHAAQGLSLVAQIPPTSAAGIRRYWDSGNRVTAAVLLWLGLGFLVGGIVGALIANWTTAAVLQWAYVIYLFLLDALLLRRRRAKESAEATSAAPDPHRAALLAVGCAAGVSSGFLGIGGGLATVVGLSAVLGMAQHRAQMISLALTLVPTTLPSAWIYWRHGAMPAWPTLVAVIVGLAVGTDVGARLANRVPPERLRVLLVGFVSLMAVCMTLKALG